ncbi:MAG TPA: hypothetical protein VJZ50_04990, partial [Candidatus Limnocylindrales bacterium]|nr:hypothetical protein [Candidatus Limnocylindrales bacterium]
MDRYLDASGLILWTAAIAIDNDEGGRRTETIRWADLGGAASGDSSAWGLKGDGTYAGLVAVLQVDVPVLLTRSGSRSLPSQVRPAAGRTITRHAVTSSMAGTSGGRSRRTS